MTRTKSLFLALSCAALVAVVSNCGSSSPAGGGAGSSGSAGSTGTAGSTVPAGNGTGGDTGNGTGGSDQTGNGGNVGAAGGMSGGNAGAGGPVVCRETTTCGSMGATCETTCTRGQQTSCVCFDPPGGQARLEWTCVNNVPCETGAGGTGGGNNGNGGNNGGGGNRGGFDGGITFGDGGITFGDGGITFGDGGITFGDGGITFSDGGVVLPMCAANIVSGTTTCTAMTEPACMGACTNRMQRSCLCGRGGRWTCFNVRCQ